MSIPGAGFTPYFNSALSSTAVAVRTTRTLVFYIQAINLAAVDAYLQVFDVAQAGVTVGTTTPTCSFLIPGASTASTNAGGLTQEFDIPLQLNSALTVAATTTATGSSAPGTAVIVNIGYMAG